MGARVGNLLFSSGIMGKDPASDTLPADAASQARFAFQNMRTLVENGGARLEDIGRVSVFLQDGSVRPHCNAERLKCFPEPPRPPAPPTVVHEPPGGMPVQ